jgi:ferredoxin
MPTVFCENINRKIEVPSGDINLRQALLDEGVRVYPWPRNYRPLNCGGNGLCTTCAIEVVSGMENLSPLSGKERSQLKTAPETRRLSCQCAVTGDVTIRIRPSTKA